MTLEPTPPAGAAGQTPPPAGTTPPAGQTPPAAGQTPPPAGGGDPPAARWWEKSDYTQEERDWLAARGLTEDDPLAVLPKIVKGHRAAEQRIGKGLDSILDRPAKDQPIGDWLRANAEALGLPADAAGYEVRPPADWPKDVAWDAELEASARAHAHAMGVPKAAHEGYVKLFADKMMAFDRASREGLAQAREAMMADLRKDYGEQTGVVVTRAQQAMQVLAEKAGLGADQVQAAVQVLSEKQGDAGVIRLFAAVGELMGEDAAVALGGGGPLTDTPAQARQQLAEFVKPGGEWAKATAEADHATIARLRPVFERLAKLASR
ncbi:MAG TPA: hypothetical protein PKD10_05230 [Paracoccaceae bacterium]|nr:hypothetical protein [Paracoccaceae bacterium]